jgi:hypothetical protein
MKYVMTKNVAKTIKENELLEQFGELTGAERTIQGLILVANGLVSAKRMDDYLFENPV